MDYAIGIDLGGTNIKAAAVRPSGEVLAESSAETRDDAGAAWAAGVRELIEALEARLGGRGSVRRHRVAGHGVARRPLDGLCERPPRIAPGLRLG